MHPKKPAFRGSETLTPLVSALSLLTIFWFGCSQKNLEPVSPVWDVDITLPLTNRAYTLADVVAKNPGQLHAGAGNQIVFSNSSSAEPTYVGDLLTLDPGTSTEYFKLGAFSVMFPQVIAPISFPWLPAGATVQIPDTTIPLGDITSTAGTFQSITVSKGTVTLALYNHLPVTVRVTNPVSLFNNTTAVAVFNFPTDIPPGDSAKSTSDLAGKTVDNNIRLSGLALRTFASAGPVQIPFGPAFEIGLRTSDLMVSRAFSAFIPPQQLSNNDTTKLPLDDSTIVSYARLGTGSVNLSITNRIPLNIMFKYRFADVWHVVGGVSVPLEDSILIPAGSTLPKTVDLRNCEIHSQPPGALVDSLRAVSSVIIPNSASNVNVNDTDKVVVTMSELSPIVADTVAGVLKPTTVNVHSSIALNLGDLSTSFNGQLNIPQASLALIVKSTIGSPMDLNLRLIARNRSGVQTAVLPVPSQRVNPGTTPVVFDSNAVGVFLSSLTGGLPDSIALVGSVLVNPVYVRSPAGIRYVGRNSSVGGDANLDIPMRLGIVGDATYADTISLNDPDNKGYKDFVDKAKTDELQQGSVFLEVSNGTPVGVDVSFRWLDSLHALLVRLPQNGDTVHVTAAPVDGNGYVTVPAQSSSVIRLTAAQSKEFSKAAYFSKSLTIRTTQGSPAVRFRTTDFVSIRAWSSFTTRVGQ